MLVKFGVLRMDARRIRRGPFIIKSSKEVYSNPWITVREDQVVRPGGTDGVFGIIEMKGGSSILPIDRDGQVYLAREYKYGVERETLELFSGGIDSGETALEAAQRELEEELGLIAKEWVGLGVVDPFTTVVKSPNHMFIARQLSEGIRKPDEGEQVEPFKVSIEEAISLVINGTITHAASCVAILRCGRMLGV